MSVEETDEVVSEGAVSGNQASIPAEVREAADIEDGDRIRWHWEDGELRVEVIRERYDTLPEDFEGFEPESESESESESEQDGSVHHDESGLEPSGEWDQGEE